MMFAGWKARAAIVLSASLAAGAWGAGCGATTRSDPNATLDAGADMTDSGVSACTACTSDQDCNGAVCAELGNASFCTALCPNGDECASDTSCEPAITVSGSQQQVCVPRVACA